jgi:tRNA(Ser,Leu) C12 N-acetylase TAN1
MIDWNVVITIYQEGLTRTLHALHDLGTIERTAYYNILVMRVDDPRETLAAIERRTDERPALYDAISRVAPAMRNFQFQSAETFQEAAKSILLEWTPQLAGRSFHVRWHRRGTKHDLRKSDMERFFDGVVIEATKLDGQPATVSFTDPDVVVAIDTIDDRAGMALWTREELAQHRLLRPG